MNWTVDVKPCEHCGAEAYWIGIELLTGKSCRSNAPAWSNHLKDHQEDCPRHYSKVKFARQEPQCHI